MKEKINKCNKKDLFDYNKGEFERTKTIISELFGWFKQTNSQCNCGGNTFDFIPDFYFSFNLQKVYKNTVNKYNLNLIDCFKEYFNDEYNIFTCQQCFKKKKGIIKKRICVLPQYLVIILDRGKDDKFNCQVDFDYSLDLNEVTEQIENKKCNTKYELIGATFLLGSSGAGHTIAYCKHFDGNYYLFNDNAYQKVELYQLKSYNPFLLFYERKK
jgi:ubiquitin C-terminal hydrolase